jgi:hypothetical protein
MLRTERFPSHPVPGVPYREAVSGRPVLQSPELKKHPGVSSLAVLQRSIRGSNRPFSLVWSTADYDGLGFLPNRQLQPTVVDLLPPV